MSAFRRLATLGTVAALTISSAGVWAADDLDLGNPPAPVRDWSATDAYRTDGTVRRVQAAPAPAPAPARPAPAPAPSGGAQPATPRPTTPAARPPAGTSSPRPAATAPATPAPTAPPAAPPPAGAGATNFAAAAASARADIESLEFNDTPIMLGDMAPLAVRQFFPTPNLQPPPTPTPGRPPIPQVPGGGGARRQLAALPWVRGFKMADNMSPRPQDRVFFTFNYFNDLNGSVNQHLGNVVRNLQAYRYILGLEKTFWDGNASIGIRMPIDNLSVTSQVPGLGGTHTAVDDLAIFSKFVVWQDRQSGSLVSTGLAIVTPNGPRSFAGSPAFGGFRDAQIQPYIGYIWNASQRLYFQGFESLDVPFDPHDVTMLYNDVGVGYFAYRNQQRGAFLTSIVPTFETHVNVPLNHQGAFRLNDIAGTPNVVDLTFGTNFVFGRSAILTVGFVDPVTGPKPFDFEWTVLLNVFFGRTRALQPSPALPIIGL